MTARGESAVGVNVDPSGRGCSARAGAGTRSVAVAGGGALDFANVPRPQPCVEYFATAKRKRNTDSRIRKKAR